jgi:hypothetical protein
MACELLRKSGGWLNCGEIVPARELLVKGLATLERIDPTSSLNFL